MNSRPGVPRADAQLQCVPGLRLQFEENGTVSLTLEETLVWRGSPEVVEVLGAFARPTRFADAMKAWGARAAGAHDWVGRAEIVRRLVASGALREAGERRAQVETGSQTFSAAPVHIRMLDDRVRTQRLIAAIRAEVQPGDIVVEVGTGTGVLAIAAAQAGARHVYAIEAGAMAPVAREMARANGVADRVTVIDGWSHAVTLPERGDVFVSETIGNAGFDENLVAIARDAVERLLKPGARMIPRRLSLRALPVEASTEWLARQLFRPETAARWAEWYGIDFSVLPALPVAAGLRQLALVRGADAVKTLGPAVDLAEAVFYPSWRTTMESAPVAELTSAGEWNALRVFFEAELSPGIVLSTDPRPAADARPDHWATPLWLLPAQAVQPGQRWQIDFAWAPRGRHKLAVHALSAMS